MRLDEVVLYSTRASQPSAGAVPVGALYGVSDEGGALERSNGSSWDSVGGGAGVGTGDVLGASSSVDTAIARYSGTTGKHIQGYSSNTPTISGAGLANFPGTVVTPTMSGSVSASGTLTIQSTTHATKGVTYIEPSLGGKVQMGTADPSFGPLNGGMFINPQDSGAAAFITGGGFFLITGPADKDSVFRVASFDNNQGIDFWNANASGDNFCDTRYVHRSDTETYTGTRFFFRMNTGGNVLIGPTGTPFELLTLAAGGSTSGGGMVGIGAGGYAPQAGLHITNAVLAKPSSGRAWGVMAAQTLTAVANNDALTAVTIDPTFADGGKSGVKHYGLVVTGGNVGIGTTTPATLLDINSLFNVTSAGYVGIGTTTPGGTVPLGYTAGKLLEMRAANDLGIALRPFNSDLQGLDVQARSSGGHAYVDNRYASGDVFFRVKTATSPITAMVIDHFGEVTFGVSGTNTGIAHFVGSTSGNVSIQSAAAAGTWTLTWPTAAPASSGYVLSATTGGVCSWIAAGAGDALTTSPLSQFAATTSLQFFSVLTNPTGTGLAVFNTSPTLVTPVLGTPSSGTLTSCTGLPVATGISGLASGIATWLATPSSANLLAALTDKTGTGVNVFATSPTLVTPTLGVASATSLATSAASPFLLTNGQLVTIALTSQTSGAATATIPDFAGVNDEFTFKTKAQTLSNKTFVAPVLGVASATSLATSAASPLLMTNGKLVTIALTSQTVNPTTLTIPDFASVSDSFAFLALAQTFTNKRITLREVSVADATTITPNCDTSDVVTQANTQTAGTLTLANATGTPTASQRLYVRVKTTNQQTWAFGTEYRGSDENPLPSVTTIAKYDYLAFARHVVDSKWDLLAVNRGF